MNTANCFAVGSSNLNCPGTTAVDNVFAVLAIAVNLLSRPLVFLLNTLIITAVRKKRRLQTAHNILLASMAGTDLVVGIFTQPVFIARKIFRISGGSISDDILRQLPAYVLYPSYTWRLSPSNVTWQ